MAHHSSYLEAFENDDFPRPVHGALPSLSVRLSRLQSPRATTGADRGRVHTETGTGTDTSCRAETQPLEETSRIIGSPAPQEEGEEEEEEPQQRGNIWNLGVQSRWFSFILNGYWGTPSFLFSCSLPFLGSLLHLLYIFLISLCVFRLCS